ncbi:MAG: ParB-like nuclease domain-containing protein [Treponema sp.]|nr:ParB-like nuclease domain-containing protein [Treponema sp.]
MKKALTISMDMDAFSNSNTGVAKAAKYIATDSVKTDPEFENLFLQDKENIDSIAEKIKAEGFSDAHPLIIWKEKDILVDGHTRLKAARKAGCFQVPVMYESFASREEALQAAMDEQIQRRNLSDNELMTAVEKYTELYGEEKVKYIRKKLTSLTGKSKSTVERAMAIAQDEEAVKDVKNGASISGAYNKLMERKHPKEKNKSDNVTKTVAERNTFPEATEQQKKGYADGFETGFLHAVALAADGKTPKEMLELTDLSHETIQAKYAKLPKDEEKRIKELRQGGAR